MERSIQPQPESEWQGPGSRQGASKQRTQPRKPPLREPTVFLGESISFFWRERNRRTHGGLWKATALALVTGGGGHTRAKFEPQCDDFHKRKVTEKVPGSGLPLLFIHLSESYSPDN